MYNINWSNQVEKGTKRVVISVTIKTVDPFRFLSSCIVVTKLLLKSLWVDQF